MCSEFIFSQWQITLPVSIPDEEKKLTEIYVFTLLCGASKGFMKVLYKRLHKNF